MFFKQLFLLRFSTNSYWKHGIYDSKITSYHWIESLIKKYGFNEKCVYYVSL